MTVSLNGTSGIVFNDASTQNTSAFTGGFAFRNRIINGAMVIDQRNAGASVTVSTVSKYGADRWGFGYVTSGTYTAQQVADAPSGFNYSSKITVTSTTTANDLGNAYQSIEGFNALDLGWGTANAQPITLSFWVKANNIGTYCASIWFSGSTVTYYYVAPYTITAANTWQQIVLNVQGAPVGAGAFTAANNTRYMLVSPITIGSSGQTGTATANTWSSSTGNFKTSDSFNLASTASATFQFTGVQLEKGSTATSFDYRPYGTELQLCQRYLPIYNYSTGNDRICYAFSQTTTVVNCLFSYVVTPRVPPTGISVTNPTNFKFGSNANYTASAVTFNSASYTVVDFYLTISGGTALQPGNLFCSATGQIQFTGCEL